MHLMSVSDEFERYVCDQLERWARVSVRRMFGGAGLYHRGLMFGLIADDVAYLKVDDSNRGDFEAAGMKPFRPYDSEKVTMSYYQVPAEVLEDPGMFGEWAEGAYRAALRARKK
jgi:DNA transformation protein